MRKTGIKLRLTGMDGNAFSIIGRARVALRRGKKGDLVEQFTREATSGDYTHLLSVCAEWFDIE